MKEIVQHTTYTFILNLENDYRVLYLKFVMHSKLLQSFFKQNITFLNIDVNNIMLGTIPDTHNLYFDNFSKQHKTKKL
jgi:hypothetical protein